MPAERTQSTERFLTDLWQIILINGLLWAILPGLFFGNLHSDTLEAAYWAHDLAWGYSKHPPLLSWILATFIIPGRSSVFQIALLGQCMAGLSACYIYRLVDHIAGRSSAKLAGCMMLATGTATFYSIQVNHNSALMPFCAAVLYYGYRYLEERRIAHAIGLGLAAGLGMLTKYEIIFAITPVLFLCLSTQRFRPALFSRGAIISILIASSLVLPHIAWQFNHQWSSFTRAVSSSPVTSLASILFGLWGMIIGLVAILGFPSGVLCLARDQWSWPDHQTPATNDHVKLGKLFLLFPILSVLAAALITEQSVKALWMLPLAPSVIAGLVLILNIKAEGDRAQDVSFVKATSKICGGIFLFYLVYLFIGEVIDNPAESYIANTRPLSVAAETLWSKHSKLPLKCVVTDEAKLATSAVLWMSSRPQILPIFVADWANSERIADCSETGGIAIKFEIDEPFNVETKFPNACVKSEIEFHVTTVLGIARTGWNAKLIYIPPNNMPSCS